MIPADHPLSGRLRKPRKHLSTRVLLHGVDGIGKTSFAKHAPDPLFLCAEKNESDLPAWIPSLSPSSWPEVLEDVRALLKDPMGRKSFVVDTIDWLEPMIVKYICTRDNNLCKGKLLLPDGRPYMEGYGYHGGSVLAGEWEHFLGLLEQLRSDHGVNIVLLAHSGRTRFRNASGMDYDLIGPKIHRQCTDLVCEWPETVLYAEYYKTPVEMPDERRPNSKGKMISSGDRICWTQHQGAHRAKNRSSMPAQMKLSWHEFAKYALADLESLRHQVAEKLALLNNPTVADRVAEWFVDHGEEAGVFFEVLERLDQRLKDQTNAKKEES